MIARRRPRGFTLIELMVVLAMIGVLAGIAAVMLNPQPRPDDASQVMAALVREASRKAVEGGSVRDVADAADTARTLVRVSQRNGQISFTVELQGDDETWRPIAARTIGRGVSIEGSTSRAVLDDGALPEEPFGDGDQLELRCYPDGLCDGLTVYFRARGNRRARTAILPLGGAPMTFKRW